jgi:hypothetical protein
MGDVGERPPWDQDAANRLLDKSILVGLTYERPDGELIARVQLHGTINRVDARHGIGIERAGTGELFWLPPDLRSFDQAPPGEYRLRSGGEVVTDPDLLSSWTIREPSDDVEPDWRASLRAGFEPPDSS